MEPFNYEQFFAENLKIVDNDSNLVPFVTNSVQKRYQREKTNRNLILKARQQGFSSYILAKNTTRFLLKPNFTAMTIADRSENAEGLLGRVKNFLRSFEEIRGIKVPLKYNSKYELYNADNHSKYIIGSAENPNVGRSKTINSLHISEAAFCKDLEALLSGVLQAVPESGEVDLETTANGFNYYQVLWTKAVNGENQFNPMFFRASDFYSPEFLATKQKELGRFFPQEYPETPEEAFLTSGDLYFDKQALAWHLQNVKEPL